MRSKSKIREYKAYPNYGIHAQIASVTPLGETEDEGETDKEAYSTDKAIETTDDDKEEVERKAEKPKSKEASKIPRIIVTDDDTRSEDVDNELERKGNDMARIPRRHKK